MRKNTLSTDGAPYYSGHNKVELQCAGKVESQQAGMLAYMLERMLKHYNCLVQLEMMMPLVEAEIHLKESSNNLPILDHSFNFE